MAKVLGLDVGTTSIGWAYVHEDEGNNTRLIDAGVRIVPLSSDEQQSFKKGKSITTNADRTAKRAARRNLQRYKLRREEVKRILKKIGFIDDKTILAEYGRGSKHKTYALRAKAPNEKISREAFANVLLMLNKKRGYKSSRKASSSDEGEVIDGMAVALKLHELRLTPGQFSFELLQSGKKSLPSYYPSDLEKELEALWKYQSQFYPETLTDEHYTNLSGKNKKQTDDYFIQKMAVTRAENKAKNKKLEAYEWRSRGLSQQITLEELAFCITEINNQINQTSSYLGEISDRSKSLYFEKLTVGQYLHQQLVDNPHAKLKGQVFYRQDYINEFDAIWEQQARHYPALNDEVRKELREVTIFYQRRLKSQKGLINKCELETQAQLIDGKTRQIGPRVAPKSSPVFQVFRIWQQVNNIRVSLNTKDEAHYLDEETRHSLFTALNTVEGMTDKQFLTWLFGKDKSTIKKAQVNFKSLAGNRTNARLIKAYKEMIAQAGYDVAFESMNAETTNSAIQACFEEMGIDPSILTFDYQLTGNAFSQQPGYELWHLLYSAEDDYTIASQHQDKQVSHLVQALMNRFSFHQSQATQLANIDFEADYAGLSVRAMRKLLPHLEDGLDYSEACKLEGYNHSGSLTADELKNKPLKPKLEHLKKNTLRNPVVEKILNQMVNVVNAIVDADHLGRPDEIRIELARDLKKTAAQRQEITSAIDKSTKLYTKMREEIKEKFGLPRVSRNDLIKYRLYLELKSTGFHTLYSGTYVKPDELFTDKFNIEHIIPKALLFDDSYSNKTLELSSCNLEKGDKTAEDYCIEKGWHVAYGQRIEEIKRDISATKYKKLKMSKEALPEDFLARDLGTTAYIARQAMTILQDICQRPVTATTGTVTARLRSDWGLINTMQELNWEKYSKLGLTTVFNNRQGYEVRRIADWTKRNDHRHHALDAITVAFTRPAYIQYLNNMNARSDKSGSIYGIEKKYTFRENGGERKFFKPYDDIRTDVRRVLSQILISHKAKNKVVTKNKNRTKIKSGYKDKIQLTPRGQLHKETIYGDSQYYVTKEEKINKSFDHKRIDTVAAKHYREALRARLKAFGDDPVKAFTGKNALSKKPVVLDDHEATVPEKVKTVTLKKRYTVRKAVNPDLTIKNVVDPKIRAILFARLERFGGNAKTAFVNLDEDPIWLNEAARIPIKKVAISDVSNVESLHAAKDHLGNEITDAYGISKPSDHVVTGNNHHIAIYKDNKGAYHEEAVPFMVAVERRIQGDPVVNQTSRQGDELWITLKQNELFVFPADGFDPADLDLMDETNRSEISKHLFRVQKISSKDYTFCHHLETQVVTAETLKNKKELVGTTFYRIMSLKHLKGVIKVRINHLGRIVKVGEY